MDEGKGPSKPLFFRRAHRFSVAIFSGQPFRACWIGLVKRVHEFTALKEQAT
jgi:hypothetical protein